MKLRNIVIHQVVENDLKKSGQFCLADQTRSPADPLTASRMLKQMENLDHRPTSPSSPPQEVTMDRQYGDVMSIAQKGLERQTADAIRRNVLIHA